MTFASVANDLWQDPEITFVAAIFGVLGFAAIMVLGMMLPAVTTYVGALRPGHHNHMMVAINESSHRPAR